MQPLQQLPRRVPRRRRHGGARSIATPSPRAVERRIRADRRDAAHSLPHRDHAARHVLVQPLERSPGAEPHDRRAAVLALALAGPAAHSAGRGQERAPACAWCATMPRRRRTAAALLRRAYRSWPTSRTTSSPIARVGPVRRGDPPPLSGSGATRRTRAARSWFTAASMPTAIVTGSGGLIGSESVQHFVAGRLRRHRPRERHARPVLRTDGLDVRARPSACSARCGDSFRSLRARHSRPDAVERTFAEHSGSLELVIHTAAQPSHDWAASDPHTDFTVNANGTLNLLEATRRHAPDATFIFCSTNKVYGDLPNHLPLRETETQARARRRITATSRGSTRRCRSMPRRIRCSASPRRPRTCSCRSTAATSGCRRCASAAAVSPGPTTPARSCTASSPI